MLAVMLQDVNKGTPYLGKHLSEIGRSAYPERLERAIASGTPESFAMSLGTVPGPLWISSYVKKNGVEAAVSSDAAYRLAGGEFNRYYMRAICLQAIEQGRKVIVYRAKWAENPRDDGPREGEALDPAQVLVDLRNDYDVPPMTGMPHGPNSGLSLRLSDK
jgi:hypothetical protein